MIKITRLSLPFWLGGLAMVTASCGVVLAAYQPLWATAGTCLLVAAVLAVLQPDLCLLTAVLATLMLRPLGEDILGLSPGLVQVCPTVLATLSVAGFALRGHHGALPRWNDPFHLALAVFLTAGMLSAAINGSSPLAVAESLRSYCGYLVLGYAVMLGGLRRHGTSRLIVAIIAVMAVQLPIQILQALPHGHGGDWCVGTLGQNATSVLAFVAPGAACLALGMALETNSWLCGMAAAVFGGEMAVELLLGEAKFGLLVMPFVLLLTLSPRLRRRRAWLAAGLIILGVVLVASLAPIIIPGSPLLEIARDPLKALQYEPAQTSYRNTYALSRITQVTFSLNLLDDDPGRLGLGFGPGAATGSFLTALQGPLWTQYGHIYGFASTQMSNMILEYGLLGMVAYALALLLTLRWAAMAWRDETCSPSERGLALGFVGVWMLFLGGTLYYRDWIAGPVPCLFWTVAGTLYTLSHQSAARPSPAHVRLAGPAAEGGKR